MVGNDRAVPTALKLDGPVNRSKVGSQAANLTHGEESDVPDKKGKHHRADADNLEFGPYVEAVGAQDLFSVGANRLVSDVPNHEFSGKRQEKHDDD